MKRDLPEFGFEFEKMERFNPEAATGGALWRCKEEDAKSWQNSQKTPVLDSLFLSKSYTDEGAFLWIFGNS